MQRLHLTNGDSAAARLGTLPDGAPVLPWRDMLHEGPVPHGLDLASLSDMRAGYLAGRYGLDPVATRDSFRHRDRTLQDALAGAAELVLWFEHDLYDQLQLIQLLALLAEHATPPAPARLAQADTYLTDLGDAALAALGENAPQVTEDQLGAAHRVWQAFRGASPEGWLDLRRGDHGHGLRWLAPALDRLLAELPAPRTGLSRTEATMLSLLAAAGPATPAALYRRMRAGEEPWFLGDWPFFAILDELAAAPEPLVAGLPPDGYPFAGEGVTAARSRYLAAEVGLTAAGRACLDGRLDRVTALPLDRWLGGTHLRPSHVWRWDAAAGVLRRD